MLSDNPTELETPGPLRINLWDAFIFWLKLGFISFGGPAGQIAVMHQELVEHRHWISEKRFLHALNYCMLLPGPEAQQLATYIGWLMHRTWGGIIAGTLFILPSLFILIVLSWVYVSFGHTTWVSGFFYGIKPAVIVIVLQAAHRIGSRALNNKLLVSIAILAFAAIFVLKIPFPIIIICAGLMGYFGGKIRPEYFTKKASTSHTDKNYGRAIIDDQTPPPEHALFSWSRLTLVILVGLLLWVLPLLLLWQVFGWNHTLTQMAWFFTTAALLTFGGAYAVLPYVYQGSVAHYHWLTPSQMIDGLALGESTPGPLIMIVAFAGFIGGYTQAVFGNDRLFIAGAIAATLVTWFTFLPSFIFIFAGAPIIETTHNNLRFTAPLTAITAAIVGVIINLALFFGYHTLWPNGFEGNIDWPSIFIAAIAGIALFRFKLSAIKVIIGCSILGLIKIIATDIYRLTF